MAKGVKVKINRQAWGAQVTGSESMKAHLRGLANQVAAKLPGSTVEVEATGVVGGGSRARATVKTTITMAEEAKTGRALNALQAVVASGHRSNGNSAATRRRNAIKKFDKRSKGSGS